MGGMKSFVVAAGLLCATPALASMTLTSADFANNGPIPKEEIYPECGGQNVSPALSWSGAPAGTKSFALTDFDPDADSSGWMHWVVVSIPASATGFPHNGTPAGSVQIKNDFGNARYDGPCPPGGSGVHHYHFTLYALPGDTPNLTGKKPADAMTELSKAASEKAELIGTYEIGR